MAEIPVQRRQRRNLWPLLLLLLVVLGVAWYLWSRQQGAGGTTRTDSTATKTSLLPARSWTIDRVGVRAATETPGARAWWI